MVRRKDPGHSSQEERGSSEGQGVPEGFLEERNKLGWEGSRLGLLTRGTHWV